MARPNKMSVQKRKREREKAEKAARKRELRSQGGAEKERAGTEATREDLEAYGVLPPSEEDDAER